MLKFYQVKYFLHNCFLIILIYFIFMRIIILIDLTLNALLSLKYLKPQFLLPFKTY